MDQSHWCTTTRQNCEVGPFLDAETWAVNANRLEALQPPSELMFMCCRNTTRSPLAIVAGNNSVSFCMTAYQLHIKRLHQKINCHFKSALLVCCPCFGCSWFNFSPLTFSDCWFLRRNKKTEQMTTLMVIPLLSTAQNTQQGQPEETLLCRYSKAGRWSLLQKKRIFSLRLKT